METFLERIITSAIIIAVSFIIYFIVKKIINGLFAKRVEKAKHKKSITIMKVINNIIRTIILILAVLTIISVWGVDTKALIASLGIVGLVAGLAVQDTLKDVIAGAAIIFEDSSQRRYMGTVDYNIHSLLDIEELAPKLAKDGLRYPGMLLHTCGERFHEKQVTEENIASFQAVLKQDVFQESYRQEIRRRLLMYYETNMDNRNLRESLREMDFRGFAKVNKSLLITILVKQDM